MDCNKMRTSDYKIAIKCYFLAILLLTVISCSNDESVGGKGAPPVGGSPIVDTEFKLTLQGFGNYTKDEFIYIHPLELVEEDDKVLGSVKFWTGVADCSGTMSGIANKASFVNPSIGAQVQLQTNQSNLLSYRVTFADGTDSDCEIAGSIIHDDIAPGVVTLGSPSAQTNLASYHAPLLTIATDAQEIRVFKNGESTHSQTLNAAVWRGGLGVMSIPLNQTTSFVFQARDFAGNLSAMSSAFVIEHKNTAPPVPVFSPATQALSTTVVTTPTFNLIGTLDSSIDSVLIYVDNTYSSPILTLTRAQYEAGHNVPLTDGVLNNFILVARDSFGNRSAEKPLLIPAHQTPVYNYALLSNTLYSNSPLAVNKSSRVKILVYNGSRETTLNFPANVSSITINESSPNISVDSSKGCPVAGLSGSGSCEIHIDASYATTGIKTENLQIILNGTTVNVTVEFEVVETVVASLSASQLTSLGTFQKIDLSGSHLLFANGVVSKDLADITINGTLSADRNSATHSYGGNLAVIKSGRVYIMKDDLSVKTLASTRTYSPGSIVDLRNLGSKLAVVVNNGLGSHDIIIEDTGEVLGQVVDSNLGEGQDSVYFRSGSQLKYLDLALNVITVPGLSVTGDVYSGSGFVVVLGNSGSGNSLHKVTQSTHLNQAELAGASSFSKITNSVFSFVNGGSFGAYAGKSAVSNATQAIVAADVKSTYSPDGSEIFSSIAIKTGSGDRTTVSKYVPEDETIFTEQLLTTTFGTKIGGPYFNKDGDFFISNQSTSSVVVSRGDDLGYSALATALTINTPHFDESLFTEGQIVFTNNVGGYYRLNTIDLEDAASVKPPVVSSPVANLNYYVPSDIAMNAPIKMAAISETTVLIYYANLSSGMSFKTISIL